MRAWNGATMILAKVQGNSDIGKHDMYGNPIALILSGAHL